MQTAIDHINHYFLYFSGCGGVLPDYLSTGGSNRQTQMEGFYGTSAASSSSEASSTAEQTAANTTEI